MHIERLPSSGFIVLPLRDKGNEPMPHDLLASILSERFGGCTVTEGRGVWNAGDRTDDEPVLIYAVSSKHKPALEPVAAWLLSATRQDAIFLNIQGKASILHR